VVGRVIRPHGIRGEVSVEVRTDFPGDRFAVGSVLATDPPAAGPLTVEAARWHAGRLLVRFAGIADRNLAETLRGVWLTVDPARIGLAPRAGTAAEPATPGTGERVGSGPGTAGRGGSGPVSGRWDAGAQEASGAARTGLAAAGPGSGNEHSDAGAAPAAPASGTGEPGSAAGLPDALTGGARAGMPSTVVPGHPRDVPPDGEAHDLRLDAATGRPAGRPGDACGGQVAAGLSPGSVGDAGEGQDEFHDYQLVGLAVVTVTGIPVGTVTDVLHHGQDLLVIEPAPGLPAAREVLVPFVAAIAVEVDLAVGRLVIDPPAGLLELAAGDSAGPGGGPARPSRRDRGRPPRPGRARGGHTHPGSGEMP
jgi:ribosomal 30S subunit maturation factor RimM